MNDPEVTASRHGEDLSGARFATVLAPFVEAGIFGDSEVQLTAVVERLAGNDGHILDDEVLIAIAVAARGPRAGHVCIELSDVAALLVDDRVAGEELPWPEPTQWRQSLEACEAVVAQPETALHEPLRPLVLDGDRLYLQRYWVYERRVGDDVLARAAATSAFGWSSQQIDEALEPFFGPTNADTPDWQREAAAVALAHPFAVLAGGPGTGKTRTVARMLAAAHTLGARNGRSLHVGLAAPSGKAAARMNEAIEAAVDQLRSEGLIDAELATTLLSSTATTLHAMLGANPRSGFAHNRRNPITFDIVIVDETSMVSLPLMARLLEAVGSGAHLVLVGDPDQLASVEAGTVMGDVVGPSVDDPTTGGHGTVIAAGPLAGHVTVLRQARRFGAESGIAALGSAVRAGDRDTALQILNDGRPDVAWIPNADSTGFAALLTEVVNDAEATIRAARSGAVDDALASLSSTKVLSGTRRHALGVNDWSERIEQGLTERISDLRLFQRWYLGRPIIVTANDRLLRVSNGDVGVTVERDGIGTVVFDGIASERHEVQASRLDQLETWWAMTIHKSQGSEFDHAIVSLPPAWVPILTRELLYTGITRARRRVTIVGDEASVIAAIDRPVARASGLSDLLWPTLRAPQ